MIEEQRFHFWGQLFQVCSPGKWRHRLLPENNVPFFVIPAKYVKGGAVLAERFSDYAG